MAGATVTYEWDDSGLQAMIAKSIENIQDMTPVMKAFAEYMVLQTADRFKNEKAPDGTPWVRLNPVTKAMKKKEGKIDKILHSDGYLRLIHYEAEEHGFSLSSDRDYSAIHQYGGKAGKGHKATIPKREFIGFNDQDIKEFKETFKDWIIINKAR